MNDPHLENTALAAFLKIGRHYLFHVGRPKGVQIQFAFNGNLNWFVVFVIGLITSQAFSPYAPSNSKPSMNPQVFNAWPQSGRGLPHSKTWRNDSAAQDFFVAHFVDLHRDRFSQ